MRSLHARGTLTPGPRLQPRARALRGRDGLWRCLGFTFNVVWGAGGVRDEVGDAEYARAFDALLMPLARAFDPPLVFVSAAFDSAAGDEMVLRITHFLFLDVQCIA